MFIHYEIYVIPCKLEIVLQTKTKKKNCGCNVNDFKNHLVEDEQKPQEQKFQKFKRQLICII